MDSKLVKSAGRKPPPNAGKGRKKGSKNKTTRAAKEMLEEAFDRAGGVDELTKFAKANPAAFYQLWGRILPKNVDVTSGGESLAALAAAAFGAK